VVHVPGRKIALPLIERVTLHDFDLYTREQNPDVPITKPVFCLIGANGLGKSTFLNTINFVITGAVPDPNRRFQSAQDYLQDASRADRAEDYFGGRLSVDVRATVTAAVTLRWPQRTIAVTREIFGAEGVVRLECVDTETGEVTVYDAADAGAEDINAIYRQYVLDLCGLDEFAQFVFLAHFVATFDEGRHLLMWDDNALTNALYLAFGADPADARAADRLQHEMDRESSRGRNVRFSARHVTERIDQLTEFLKNEQGDAYISEAEIHEKHRRLQDQLAQADDRARRKRVELRDAESRWVELSAQMTEMQLEYRRLFSTRLQSSSSVDHHPLIRTTIADDRCALCGAVHVKQVIQSHLDARECPLCDSALANMGPLDGGIEALEALDRRIAAARDELGARLETRQRVADQLKAAEAHQDGCRSELDAFRDAEASALARAGLGSDFSAIRTEIERLEKERNDFISQSKAHYAKRDELREKLRVHEKRLRAQYEVGSQQFVPRFRELAESFIGIPIDVELDHRNSVNEAGFGLRLRMNEQLRLQAEDVSESQRFFLDIALRMALTEFMSEGPATLLIDTPEGSLDIAYEARAGIMFGMFVDQGNRMLMTANLRSSELILRLARLQKDSGMEIVRMTKWTDLSEVQLSEEDLFTKAFVDIEDALK
jgi:ABC-type cobalamin transport system ATPase subunit